LSVIDFRQLRATRRHADAHSFNVFARNEGPAEGAHYLLLFATHPEHKANHPEYSASRQLHCGEKSVVTCKVALPAAPVRILMAGPDYF
jgi:hypothetical protein